MAVWVTTPSRSKIKALMFLRCSSWFRSGVGVFKVVIRKEVDATGFYLLPFLDGIVIMQKRKLKNRC